MGRSYNAHMDFGNSPKCLDTIVRSLDKNVSKILASDIKSIREGKINELLKIKIMSREVSVLPYFINYCTYSQNTYKFKQFVTKYFSDNIEQYIKLGKDGIEKILEKNDLEILKCLIGSDCEYINKYVSIFSYQSQVDYYSNMLNVLKIDTVNFFRNGANLIEFSDNVENSMGICLAICLKWFNEKKIIAKRVLNVSKNIDKLLNKLLKKDMGWYRYFNNEINENELYDILFKSPVNVPMIDKFEFEKHSSLMVVGQSVREIVESQGVTIDKLEDNENLGSNLMSMLSKIALSKLLYNQVYGLSDMIYKKALITDMDIVKYTKDKYKTEDSMRLDIENKKSELIRQKDEITNKSKENKRLLKEVNRLEEEVKESKTKIDIYEKDSNPKLEDAYYKLDIANKEINKLKDEYNELQNYITELNESIDKLYDKNRSLKDKNKQLQKEINELNGVNLDSDEQESSEEEYKLSIEELVDEIKDKRIMVIGGRQYIEENLRKLGFNSIKQMDIESHNYINSNIDLGDYDCMVIIASCVKHAATFKAVKHAKSIGARIIRVSSNNVDKICEEMYNEIRKDEIDDIHN